jgi:UDP-glucose 4-epimerase
VKLGVTGGSGFIGSHVVDALVAAGHELVVIDTATPYRPDVEHRPVDLQSLDALVEATRDLEFVFHLAAYADVNDVDRRPIDALDLNVGGTLKVLEAARINGVRRVVLASTVWVYSSVAAGEGDVIDETAEISLDANRHVYTSTKLAAEMLCHDYWHKHGLPFTIFRYGIPYGPRMRPSLVIPVFFRKAISGEPLTLTGDGRQHRKFVYVKDLARAHVLALSDAAENKVFNLDGAEKVTIREIAESILKLTGSIEPIAYVPARAGDYGGADVSSERARQLLGWTPETPFEAGLEKTVLWLMEGRRDALVR